MPRSKNPLTKEQRAEISRRNGAKSHGPTSPEGRHRVSANAIDRGLYAVKHIVMDDELFEAYEEMRDAYIEEFAPTTRVETDLVLQMSEARWRLRRIGTTETTTLDMALALAPNSKRAQLFDNPDERTLHSIAFHEAAAAGDLASIHRAELRALRVFDKAFRQLKDLRTHAAMLAAPEPLLPDTHPTEAQEPAEPLQALPETAPKSTTSPTPAAGQHAWKNKPEEHLPTPVALLTLVVLLAALALTSTPNTLSAATITASPIIISSYIGHGQKTAGLMMSHSRILTFILGERSLLLRFLKPTPPLPAPKAAV